MTDHTILVVDANEETEETIVSTLEAQGYLVFTASGRDISTGLAEKISPSLIYVKPAAISVEGFATCKLIHHTEKFKKVPILLLASLKGPLDPRYTTFYGVLDYLKLPLDPEEVLKKTAKILGNQSHDIQVPDDDFGLDEEESSPYEEAPLLEEPHVVDSDPGDRSSDMQAPEDEFGLTEEAIVPVDEKPGYGTEHAGETETDKILDIGQPNEDYRYRETNEPIQENFHPKGTRRRSTKTGLFIPLVIVAAGITIVLAGFLLYKFFISSPKVTAPAAVSRPQPLPQKEAAIPPLQQEPQKQEQAGVKTMPVETKEVPVKETPVATENKADGKPFYSVQLGAFKNEATASVLVKKYLEKGYEAYTLKGETNERGTLYRVLVGTFKSRKEAFQLATQIASKENVQTTVFSGGKK